MVEAEEAPAARVAHDPQTRIPAETPSGARRVLAGPLYLFTLCPAGDPGLWAAYLLPQLPGALISALIIPQGARTRPAPTVLWAFSPQRRGEKGSHSGLFLGFYTTAASC